MSLVCLITQQHGSAWCSVHDAPAPAKPRASWTTAWTCGQAPPLGRWHVPNLGAVLKVPA